MLWSKHWIVDIKKFGLVKHTSFHKSLNDPQQSCPLKQWLGYRVWGLEWCSCYIFSLTTIRPLVKLFYNIWREFKRYYYTLEEYTVVNLKHKALKCHYILLHWAPKVWMSVAKSTQLSSRLLDWKHRYLGSPLKHSDIKCNMFTFLILTNRKIFSSFQT